ncbi:MAG: Lsm family RNA-binding protein [Candidatus Freyarchaeota archaeon]|nr:Lsm family RNA-binding protein [Candidatus Freyrarchaeum guaymaensis]HDO80141.1 small nuclear ribonucleoprotein (Sm) [Candidatus Bathyarchaeota archaeon]
MSGSITSSSFFRELTALVGKTIKVNLEGGKAYIGKLRGYEANSLSLCLTDAKDEEGNTYNKVFIKGERIIEFFQTEESFLGELYERIRKVFPPGDVEFLEDNNLILVVKKVKVTEKGVEGEGPIARRVKEIFDEFMSERKAAIT